MNWTEKNQQVYLIAVGAYHNLMGIQTLREVGVHIHDVSGHLCIASLQHPMGTGWHAHVLLIAERCLARRIHVWQHLHTLQICKPKFVSCQT